MGLVGKTAFVTGAARRLGRISALALANAGADIILHAHTSPTDDLVEEIHKVGRRAEVVRGDLSRETEVMRVAEEALVRAGKIEVLVNNAAAFFASPVDALTPEVWRQVLRVNLTAPFIFALRLGRIMRSSGSGKIIQLGDWSGQRPVPHYLPYCVAKGGLHVLTVVLAKALAPRVQVNEVVLGPVLPPDNYDEEFSRELVRQTPLRRLGDAKDVARVVCFLAEASEFVTGGAYTVDGGWLANVPGGTRSL
jgi:pteridine reductase